MCEVEEYRLVTRMNRRSNDKAFTRSPKNFIMEHNMEYRGKYVHEKYL